LSPRALGNGRLVRTLYRVQSFCAKEHIPLAAFIGANMHGLKGRLQDRRTFQPNMLLGDKALVRYNIFVKKSESLLRVARANILDAQGEFGKLLQKLTTAEIAAGEDYVASFLVGDKTSPPAPLPVTPFVPFGIAAQTVGQALVRRRAMVYVLAQYRTGLGDYVGSNGEPTWEALAALLLRMFGFTSKRENPALPEMVGLRYW